MSKKCKKLDIFIKILSYILETEKNQKYKKENYLKEAENLIVKL